MSDTKPEITGDNQNDDLENKVTEAAPKKAARKPRAVAAKGGDKTPEEAAPKKRSVKKPAETVTDEIGEAPVKKTRAPRKVASPRKKADPEIAPSESADTPADEAEAPADAVTDPGEVSVDASESSADKTPTEVPAESVKEGEQPEENSGDGSAAPAVEPPAPEVKKPVHKPQTILINDLIRLTHEQVLKRLQKLDTKVNANRSKIQLMLEIIRRCFGQGDRLEATGIFTYNSNDGSGVLLFEEQNFAPSALDIYVSQNFIQRYKLKPGLKLRARLHAPKEKDKRIALDQILAIEDKPLEDWKELTPFDQLTPLFPKERIILETKDEEILDGRVIDLIAPLGKGQRGLIIAPPRVGKTILLKHIAQSITQNHPEIELLILLVDERPEEVTDMKREVKASVYSSTFDEGNHRHIQISELVLERARRLVEQGRDVVILLDSLTRLARGYNNQTGNKGRLLSGGIDPKALQKAGRFFSVARNAEEGGSLTLLASVLVDTGSKLDQVIYEEFKGKGNMDIQLDRMLVEKRIFPGIHIVQSGTRKEDFLYHPDELRMVQTIRKQLAAVPAIEAMETLISNIRKTGSNAELILRGLR